MMKKEEGEYVIHISGGGDPNTPHGYSDYSIKKIGDDQGARLEYFTVYHQDPRRHIRMHGKKLICSPDGNYVS
eukprot:SAG25_NODE_885_length_4932_cov_8.691082_6_plen_73_part_00